MKVSAEPFSGDFPIFIQKLPTLVGYFLVASESLPILLPYSIFEKKFFKTKK